MRSKKGQSKGIFRQIFAFCVAVGSKLLHGQNGYFMVVLLEAPPRITVLLQ